MKRKRISIYCLSACLLIAALYLLGCGGKEMASIWRKGDVTIDGQDSEWQGAMYYLDDAGVALGLLNDEEYLYLCLATVDSRLVRQVAGSGLTVWFDPQGGKKRVFGINFPLGMDPSSMGDSPENMSRPEAGEGGTDPEKFRQMLEKSAREMVILGPDKKESRRMPVAGSEEVKAKLGYDGGKLIYELRVPLIRDLEHPDAVGLEEGDRVGLGLETAEIDQGTMKERMRSGGPPGGGTDGGGPPMGGGMEGGGMPGGRGPGGQGPGGQGPGGEMPERLQLWTKVILANEESAASL